MPTSSEFNNESGSNSSINGSLQWHLVFSIRTRRVLSPKQNVKLRAAVAQQVWQTSDVVFCGLRDQLAEKSMGCTLLPGVWVSLSRLADRRRQLTANVQWQRLHSVSDMSYALHFSIRQSNWFDGVRVNAGRRSEATVTTTAVCSERGKISRGPHC